MRADQLDDACILELGRRRHWLEDVSDGAVEHFADVLLDGPAAPRAAAALDLLVEHIKDRPGSAALLRPLLLLALERLAPERLDGMSLRGCVGASPSSRGRLGSRRGAWRCSRGRSGVAACRSGASRGRSGGCDRRLPCLPGMSDGGTRGIACFPGEVGAAPIQGTGQAGARHLQRSTMRWRMRQFSSCTRASQSSRRWCELCRGPRAC